MRFETKVSPSGSPDALFEECIAAVRDTRARLQLDTGVLGAREETEAVTKLKQDELELTRKIFQRVDGEGQMTSGYEFQGHHIDPYWNPFNKVRDLKEQITAEFDQYRAVVSVAEAKRTRIQIKKSLRRTAPVYNPYTEDFRRWHGRGLPNEPPKPFRIPDKHWERTPLQEKMSREKITWRDVDIIQHYLADNGYILPRRTTTLSRRGQKNLVKAVRVAQQMSLIPYSWKPEDYNAMPLMDPLQWAADRLTERVREDRDRRSRAMLQVMMERYPELNYHNFLKLEADRAKPEQATEATPGI